ncbi:hypothetical protein [Pseudomonas sp. 2995-1]|uniref:hypothetical protein n=1 Tax=Pseudomonas sp. 2995-1 TaxID=1712679 RepID=UPI000C149E58|nr:hypothetical protein [Pseudomonas sp. 2995-1]PIB61094.1 hypothetical protein AOA61_00180 [Pseudomonas sp. 2995-1]
MDNVLIIDMLYQLFVLITVLIVPILVVVVIVKVVRRMDRRADERLKLDKENAALQQQQIKEINARITNIEKMLKEVD